MMIALIGLFSACGNGPSPEQKALAEKEAANKAAYEKFNAAWEAKDKATLSELLSDDFVTHNPDPMIPSTGKQQILDQVDAYFGMSSDMKASGQVMLVDGDLVAGVALIKGTNDGAMGDMPATGKAWEATAMDVLRFENGKIVEHWGVFDAMSMMSQLGMFDGEGHGQEEMAMDKEHVCTKACVGDKHVYAHGEKGHVCGEECIRMREKKS